MESSRTQINLVAGGFTNLYTAASITVGMKLGLQNLSSDPIIITLGTSGSVNNGYILNPLESTVIPAGVTGCFVQTVTGEAGVVALDVGGYNIHGMSIDERVYTGLKALTVQPFIESNVKNSTEWEFSSINSNLGAGLSQDAVFIVGSQPVLIKNRQITFTGAQITAQLFEAPTYTGGTPAVMHNLNRITPNAPLSTSRYGVTVSDTGTECGAPTYALGATDQGNRTVGTFTVTGLERVLKPNTTYLLRITNNDTVAVKVATYVTFYEGEISSLNG